MRKFALLGTMAGLALLGVPAGASANAINSGSDCNYATAPPQAQSVGTTQAGNQVYVYEGAGSTGNAGTTAVGACGNVGGKGGFAEAGSGTQGTYAVVDGSDNNPAPANGYMGLSNYDDSTTNPKSCSQAGGDPASTNGGGCFGVKGGPTVNFNSLGLGAVPTPMCGDTSGPDWNKTPRDGCFIP